MDQTLAAPPRTSVAAVWSLVLGILSMFCLWLLGSIPAIILGIVALTRINAQPTKLGGRGLAISGIVTGSIGILTGLVAIGIVASLFLPAYSGIQQRAVLVKQQSEIRTLILGCRAYAADREGLYPETLADLYPEYTDSEAVLYADEEDLKPYLYRSGLTDSSERTPLIMSPEQRNGSRIVGYTDGTVMETSEPLPPDILAEFE